MNNTRRNFLRQLTVAASVSTLPISLAAHPFTQSAEADVPDFSFAVEPYLQNLQQDEVTIFTVVSRKAFTWVELVDENGKEVRFYEVNEGLRHANDVLSRVTINGLKPNTSYTYRVCSKEITKFDPYKIVYGAQIRTTDRQFKTLDTKLQDSVSCCIFNDVHEDTATYGDLLSLIDKKKLDFVVNNGDAVHHLSAADDYSKKALAPLSKELKGSIPMVINRGNHETRGGYAFDYNTYVKHDSGHYYHSFAAGNVYWIFLDTGEDKPDDHEVYAGLSDYDAYRQEQAMWLTKVMASKAYKKAKFKVVVMHIPTYHSDEWHGTVHCRNQFSPLFDKNGVDLVVAGHSHQHGHYPPDKDHKYTLLIGGGPKKGNRTLVTIDGDGNSLAYKMLLDDGSILAENRLTK